MGDFDHYADVHPSRRQRLIEEPQPSSSQQQNQTSQPPAGGSLFGNTATSQSGGGLFGSTTQTSQPAQGGGLFGSTAQTSQPAQGGGLFGSTATSQPAQGGGLFGSTTNQASNTGGGLFGNTNNNQSNTGGGLFGSSTQQKPGGLFGSSTTQQPAQTGGLFGSSNMNAQQPAGQSLFGSAQQTQPQQSSNLFGSTTNSLFGRKPEDNPQLMTGNQFWQSANQQNKPAAGGNSILGLSAYPPAQIPSLLASTQHRQSQIPATFAPKLSMGAGNTTTTASDQQSNTAVVGAVNVSLADLRGTTRFQDLQSDLKSQFELMEKMIQDQERFARQVRSMVDHSQHGAHIASIAPDVELVGSKAEGVEHTLARDAGAIDTRRGVVEQDWRDFQRVQRVVENLKLPPGYQVPSAAYGYSQRLAKPAHEEVKEENAYDTDLIGNYFAPLAQDLSRQLEQFAGNLKEVEGHMAVIEGKAVREAQGLAARRAGVGGGGMGSGEDTVAELRDTLVGFEQSILGVAGTVGECRTGVDELVLGRAGARGVF